MSEAAEDAIMDAKHLVVGACAHTAERRRVIAEQSRNERRLAEWRRRYENYIRGQEQRLREGV